MSEIKEGRNESQNPTKTTIGKIPIEGWTGLEFGQKARECEKKKQYTQARNYYYQGLQKLLQVLQLTPTNFPQKILCQEAKDYIEKLKELLQPTPRKLTEEEEEEAKLREKIRRRIIKPDKTLSRKDLIGLNEDKFR